MKRILICLVTIASLSGCQLSLDGLASTATSTVGAVVGTVVGGPTVGAVVGAAAGAATDAVIPSSKPLSAIPEEDRAEVLEHQNMWQTIENLGYWGIAAVFLFFAIPMVIGYYTPNRRQRRLEKIAMDHPDIKSRDIE